MADKLKVVITDEQNEVKVQTGIRMLLRRCCHAVLQNESFKGSAEIGITFTDNRKLEKLSVKHFGHATKRESFSLLPKSTEDTKPDVKVLGDVFISFEKAVEVANNTNNPLRRHLAGITADGVLELLGYSDSSEKKKKTELALNQLGLPVSSMYFIEQ